MIRFAFLALLAMGVLAAPIGESSVAHAQKKKRKAVKRKKGKKTVRRTKKAARKTIARKKAKKAKRKAVRIKTKAAIRNTNKVLAKARGAVKLGTKGRADLRAAVIRQQAARRALAAGKRRHAFYLTRLSRKLARGVIKANGMTVAEDPAADVVEDPSAGDIEEIGGIIKAVEDEGKVPAEDKIVDDETIGVDQPEDLGEDDTGELEKEVEMEKETAPAKAE